MMKRIAHLRVILIGGIAVGILDGIAAIVSASLRGVTATRLFQYVAAGLLGPASFQGGLPTALLGVFFEFFIATCVMAVFYLASRLLPVLVRYAAICGLIYGVMVFFFMNKVIVPLSSVPKPKSAPPFSHLLPEILIHMFCVGLPAALVTWAFSRRHAIAH